MTEIERLREFVDWVCQRHSEQSLIGGAARRVKAGGRVNGISEVHEPVGDPDFPEGARVQYTTLGLEKVGQRSGQRQGTIVRTSNSVWVRWDGVKTAYAFHRDYLEVIGDANA